LYGFLELDTKNLFEQLINVNGVGPKVGLSILSVGSVNAVRVAIASGDIKLIQSAPGVGKRVAERLLIELKDKVGLVSTLDSNSLLMGEEAANQDEAVQALVALGFNLQDALIALKPIDQKLSTEERVKIALRTK
jgi:Holliday junction DNA helicase RuvA